MEMTINSVDIHLGAFRHVLGPKMLANEVLSSSYKVFDKELL